MIEDELNEVFSEIDGEGIDVSDSAIPVLDYTETVTVDDRPFYTTSFSDYSVTEGLLLFIFVILLVQFFLNLVRRWF